jgi:hypothetical protein
MIFASILELLRDALELKKLNNNLMKITMFEDLIADLYAEYAFFVAFVDLGCAADDLRIS